MRYRQWLDLPASDDSFRRKIIYLLSRLAAASSELPPSLFVVGVELGPSRDPVAHGGFADIFRGRYKGQWVAVKRARVSKSEKAKYHRVRRVVSSAAIIA